MTQPSNSKYNASCLIFGFNTVALGILSAGSMALAAKYQSPGLDVVSTAFGSASLLSGYMTMQPTIVEYAPAISRHVDRCASAIGRVFGF